jgi:hypothetical protein
MQCPKWKGALNTHEVVTKGKLSKSRHHTHFGYGCKLLSDAVHRAMFCPFDGSTTSIYNLINPIFCGIVLLFKNIGLRC